MAITWSQDYTVEWRLMKVNKDTWADSGRAEFVNNARIDRDMTASVPLLESATFDAQIPIGREWENGWYRLRAIVTQGTETESIPIGTFRIEAGSDKVDFGTQTATLKGYSVLYPASKSYMDLGSYIPLGTDGPEFVRDLLKQGGVCAPIHLEGSYSLDDYVTYDNQTQVIKVVWDILDAGGYCMVIDGEGEIWVKPKPVQRKLVFNSKTANLLFPGVTRNLDYSDVPNVYKAYSGEVSAKAVNDNPDSIVSTVSRGYEHQEVATNPMRVNGESLQAYCERMLEELSTLEKTYVYNRENISDARPFDVVNLTLPQWGVESDLRILSQSIECGKSIKVSETAAIIIKEYVAK